MWNSHYVCSSYASANTFLASPVNAEISNPLSIVALDAGIIDTRSLYSPGEASADMSTACPSTDGNGGRCALLLSVHLNSLYSEPVKKYALGTATFLSSYGEASEYSCNILL